MCMDENAIVAVDTGGLGQLLVRAHADADDLLGFAQNTARQGRVTRVALVHGEAEVKDTLAESLRVAGIPEVIISARGDRIEL